MQQTSKKSYIFGPVPSRRLGLSLGVDIVPMKSCTLDCIYCQLGRSSDITIDRSSFVPIDDVLAQIEARLKETTPDYITISGSGEPTLNIDLGNLIDKIKAITKVPVAVITHGTLLFDAEVRAMCAKADVVLPSLDAGDAQTFAKINRPHKQLHFDAVVEGLFRFRAEYPGQIWLEVFLVEDINTSDQQIDAIRQLIAMIRPDKVQLNTAVRPTTKPGISAISPQKMADFARRIGFGAEVIADFPTEKIKKSHHATAEAVFEMLQRRPCSLEDISTGLNIDINEATELATGLIRNNKVTSDDKNGVIYFKVK